MVYRIVSCGKCGKEHKTKFMSFKCCGILQSVSNSNVILESKGYRRKEPISSEKPFEKTQKNKALFSDVKVETEKSIIDIQPTEKKPIIDIKPVSKEEVIKNGRGKRLFIGRRNKYSNGTSKAEGKSTEAEPTNNRNIRNETKESGVNNQ